MPESKRLQIYNTNKKQSLASEPLTTNFNCNANEQWKTVFFCGEIKIPTSQHENHMNANQLRTTKFLLGENELHKPLHCSCCYRNSKQKGRLLKVKQK